MLKFKRAINLTVKAILYTIAAFIGGAIFCFFNLLLSSGQLLVLMFIIIRDYYLFFLLAIVCAVIGTWVYGWRRKQKWQEILLNILNVFAAVFFAAIFGCGVIFAGFMCCPF